MYLSLTLALGNMLAVVPPVMSSDLVPMEQSLDIIGDRSAKAQAELSPNELAGLSLKTQPELSNEFKIAQQPPTPETKTPTTTKELTFQEEIDKKILIANQYRAQKNFKREAEVLTGIGFYYQFFGAPRKGLPYIESALKISRSINDPLLQCFALNTMGGNYKSLGEYQKAQESYRQSITTFPKVITKKTDISILMQALYGMAAINDDLGETKESLKYLMEALKIAKESGDIRVHATALRYIRTNYFQRSYFEQALKYIKEASTLEASISDTSSTAIDKIAKSIVYPNNEPDISQRPAQSPSIKAQPDIYPNITRLEKEVEKRRTQGNIARELSSLDDLQFLHTAYDEYAKLYEVAQRKLFIHQKLTENRLSESKSLTEIATILNRWDRKQEAINSYNKALDIQRQLKIRPQQAETLVEIAKLYESLGAYQQSLKFYDEALNIAVAVDNIGIQNDVIQGKTKTLRLMGDTTQSLSIAQEKLVPLTKTSGNRLKRLIALYIISDIYREKGDYQKSLDTLSSALKQGLLGTDETDENYRASGLHKFGLIYLATKEYPKAQTALEQSIAIAQKNNRPAFEALRLKDLGTVYKQQQKPQQAQKSYERAISLYQKLKFRSEEADTLSLLATLQRSQGNLPAAKQSIEVAISIVEDIRKDVTSNDLRTSFLASKQDYYKIKIGILMDLHQQQPTKGYQTLALETSERGRARGLVELLTNAGIDRQLKPKGSSKLITQNEQLERDLRQVEKQRVALLSRTHTPEQASGLDRKSNVLITQIQESQNKLRVENPAYAALKYPEPITLKEIQQKVLDRDTVMLQYSIGKERSYLWLVTPTAVQSYSLPGEKDLEEIAKPFHSTLTNSGSISDVKRTGDKLFNLIISPVANQVAGKRLLVVADGVLQYIPFAAIPLPTNNYTPLIKNHEIVNAPSAATIALQRQQPRRSASKTLAIIADPVFKADDARLSSRNKASIDSCLVTPPDNSKNTTNPSLADLQRSLRTLDLRNIQRLPNTQQEAKQILALVPPNQREAACSFAANYDTVTQPQKSRLDQYRNVLFATHGFINSSNPQLSGLVLSLVDAKGKPRDGFLRLHDIFNLQLNADLVVLSACQTGLGEDIRGEGLVGLTRGFMYAGTKRVVTSLWNVDDAKTAQLMTSFFQKTLKEQQTPSAALRSAQLQLWQTNPDPRYWAAFTLQGEWLPSSGQPKS
jgi:CHAT domain-containing protein/tetratricopeptide (TPR) repeat protein